MKLPEKPALVEQSMDVPVNEVPQHKQGDELKPDGPTIDMNCDRIFDSKEPEQK